MSVFPAEDEILQKLRPLLKTAAEKLVEARKQNRFVLLRFHHDADGISAALALTQVIPCKALPQNAAAYTARDAVRDLSALHHEERPLVIFLDFGSGPESMEGLQLLHAASMEILIIDHHPPGPDTEKYASLFINPWLMEKSEKASRYPAGYLACEVAQAAGAAEIDALAYISCAGDKSDLLPVEKHHRDAALVLDYLAMHSDYRSSLYFYKGVLKSKELFQSLLQQAGEKISEITKEAQKQAREKQFGTVHVSMLDLSHLLARYNFPSRGKIATYLIERLPLDEPHIVIGYSGRFIVLRANDAAMRHGIRLNVLVETLKSSMASFIESGGGHPKAAAIRVREGFLKEVVAAFLDLLDK